MVEKVWYVKSNIKAICNSLRLVFGWQNKLPHLETIPIQAQPILSPKWIHNTLYYFIPLLDRFFIKKRGEKEEKEKRDSNCTFKKYKPLLVSNLGEGNYHKILIYALIDY